MEERMTHEIHPWAHQPEHAEDFIPVRGKGRLHFFGPNHTADSVIIGERAGEPHIALITRSDTGELAIPGGFVDTDETALSAARRETMEEIGLDVSDIPATFLYDGPVADARATLEAWPHTTAYLFALTETPPIVAADDALDAAWHPLSVIDSTPLYGSHTTLARLARTAFYQNKQ
jgi:ADP-ribose pyrophosphatase YjhB (NUDIX family)